MKRIIRKIKMPMQQEVKILNKPRLWLAWLYLPLIPFLVCTYKLSKSVGFYMEYLALPVAAWLAYRYKWHGFWVYAVGGLTFWFEYRMGYATFNLKPELYIIGLVLAFAMIRRDSWLFIISNLRAPLPVLIAIFILLPIHLKISSFPADSFAVGIRGGLLFGYVLFILGWTGIPVKRVLFLILFFGIVGIVARFMDLRLSGSFLLRYEMYGVRDIWEYTIWYFSGLVLHIYHFNNLPVSQKTDPDTRFGQSSISKNNYSAEPGQLVVTISKWLNSTTAYYTVGMLMAVSVIFISIRIENNIKFYVWGASSILFPLAFLSGFMWQGRGMQLTLSAVAIIGLYTLAIFPEVGRFNLELFSSANDAVIQSNQSKSAYNNILRINTSRNVTYILIALTAPLYCWFGMKVYQKYLPSKTSL